MNYELAKELKDAGFPYHWDKVANAEPPLGLLIGACGDDFHSLQQLGTNSWGAATLLFDANDNKIKEVGTTPEEAVARLWLSLNRKKSGGL